MCLFSVVTFQFFKFLIFKNFIKLWEICTYPTWDLLSFLDMRFCSFHQRWKLFDILSHHFFFFSVFRDSDSKYIWPLTLSHWSLLGTIPFFQPRFSHFLDIWHCSVFIEIFSDFFSSSVSNFCQAYCEIFLNSNSIFYPWHYSLHNFFLSIWTYLKNLDWSSFLKINLRGLGSAFLLIFLLLARLPPLSDVC